MVNDAFDNEQPIEYKNASTTGYIIYRCISNIFLSGPPAKAKPLRIDLTQKTSPTRVRLRNYSQEQRKFLVRFVDLLISAGMAYFNPSGAWAFFLLLVLKAGSVRFCFTVELHPINHFTVKHQFPMLHLDIN